MAVSIPTVPTQKQIRCELTEPRYHPPFVPSFAVKPVPGPLFNESLCARNAHQVNIQASFHQPILDWWKLSTPAARRDLDMTHSDAMLLVWTHKTLLFAYEKHDRCLLCPCCMARADRELAQFPTRLASMAPAGGTFTEDLCGAKGSSCVGHYPLSATCTVL